MWEFDGEEWTEVGDPSHPAESPDKAGPRFEEFGPELDIVEIVPIPPRPDYVPFPLP
jgi:hypothetical protein